jgi:hypothetical protein
MPWLHIDIEFVSEKARAKWLLNHAGSIESDRVVRSSQFEECEHRHLGIPQGHEKEDTTQAGQ